MDPVLRERNADGSGAASADGSGAKPAAQSELALPVSSAAAGDSTGLDYLVGRYDGTLDQYVTDSTAENESPPSRLASTVEAQQREILALQAALRERSAEVSAARAEGEEAAQQRLRRWAHHIRELKQALETERSRRAKETQEARRQIRAAERAQADLHQRVVRAESQAATAQEAQARWEADLAAAHDRTRRLAERDRSARQELGVVKARLNEAERSVREGQDTVRSLRAQLSACELRASDAEHVAARASSQRQSLLERHGEETAALSSQLDQRCADLARAEQEAREAAARARAAEGERDGWRRRAEEEERAKEAGRGSLPEHVRKSLERAEKAERELASARERVSLLEKSCSRSEALADEFRARADSLAEQLVAAERRAGTVAAERARTDGHLDAATTRHESLEAEAQRMRAHIGAIESERGALKGQVEAEQEKAGRLQRAVEWQKARAARRIAHSRGIAALGSVWRVWCAWVQHREHARQSAVSALMNAAMGNMARRLQDSRLRTALFQWRAHAGASAPPVGAQPEPEPEPVSSLPSYGVDSRAVRLAVVLEHMGSRRTTALKRTALAGWRGVAAAHEAEARWRERFGDLALFLRRRARAAQTLAAWRTAVRRSKKAGSRPTPARSTREGGTQTPPRRPARAARPKARDVGVSTHPEGAVQHNSDAMRAYLLERSEREGGVAAAATSPPPAPTPMVEEEEDQEQEQEEEQKASLEGPSAPVFQAPPAPAATLEVATVPPLPVESRTHAATPSMTPIMTPAPGTTPGDGTFQRNLGALLGEACSHLATALYDASERLVATAGSLPEEGLAAASRAVRDAAEAAAADASTDYTDPASMARAAARRMVRAERLEGALQGADATGTLALSRSQGSAGTSGGPPPRGSASTGRAKLQLMAALHRECESTLSWPVEVHARLLASLRASTAREGAAPHAPQGGDGTRAVMGQCPLVWASRREGEVAAARAAKAEQEAHAAYEDAAVRKARSGGAVDTLPFYLTPAPLPEELASSSSSSGGAAAESWRDALRSDAAIDKFWLLLSQPVHRLSEEAAERQVLELAMMTRNSDSTLRMARHETHRKLLDLRLQALLLHLSRLALLRQLRERRPRRAREIASRAMVSIAAPSRQRGRSEAPATRRRRRRGGSASPSPLAQEPTRAESRRTGAAQGHPGSSSSSLAAASSPAERKQAAQQLHDNAVDQAMADLRYL